MKDQRKVNLSAHKKVRTVRTDVAVIGAGLSGVVTALTCANNGLRTLLIERYGFPGGLVTSSFAYPLKVFNFQKAISELFMFEDSEAIEFPISSIVVRYLLKNNAVPKTLVPDPLEISSSIIPFDFEKFKFTLFELLTDLKVDLLFHATFVKAELKGDSVDSLIVLGKEGLIEVKANYFVDATGNCIIFSSIDEDLTRKVKSSVRYNFILSNCDFDEMDDRIICKSVAVENFTNCLFHAYVVEKDGEKFQIYELPLKDHCLVLGLPAYGFEPDDIFSISKAEEELQLKVYSFVEYLKQFKPFKNVRISMLPAQLYFTEGRRLNGLYTLTSEDVFSSKVFDDEIARIKISTVCGDIAPCLVSPDKKFNEYAICFPLSSFITDIKNLVAVGRNASVDDELRFILYSFPFVMKSSENIGRAIAFAHRNGLNLTDLRTKTKFDRA